MRAELLFEPERAHWCLDELSKVYDPPWEWPNVGSIARCSCGRYFVVDERTGLWKRLPRWSRRVREAIAHFEERQGKGGAQ